MNNILSINSTNMFKNKQDACLSVRSRYCMGPKIRLHFCKVVLITVMEFYAGFNVNF